MLKGHKEETVLEYWCLIRVHVLEKKLPLQTSSPAECRSCQSPICSRLAVENEMPSSSAPPAHWLPLSSPWSAASASYWLSPVGNWNEWRIRVGLLGLRVGLSGVDDGLGCWEVGRATEINQYDQDIKPFANIILILRKVIYVFMYKRILNYKFKVAISW